MHRKAVLAISLLAVFFSLSLFPGYSWAQLKVGDVAPGFTVSSTLDRPLDYYKDYYGKHHLVLNFIANAFGPS